MIEGICVGGPMHGKSVAIRFPKGLLAVDRPRNRCWIYEWDGSGFFNVRDELGMEVLTEGPKNRYRAAEESNYDVLAVDQ